VTASTRRSRGGPLLCPRGCWREASRPHWLSARWPDLMAQVALQQRDLEPMAGTRGAGQRDLARCRASGAQ
jgi:hypothetical protein